MKAIGIVGSPRENGNVDTLVQAVLDGAREAGYQISKYNLNEMNYSGCQACDYCNSHDHFRLEDDLSNLLTEISGGRCRGIRIADIFLPIHRTVSAHGG